MTSRTLNLKSPHGQSAAWYFVQRYFCLLKLASPMQSWRPVKVVRIRLRSSCYLIEEADKR